MSKALRDGFGAGIMEAAQKDERIMALSADLTGSNRLETFRETYPERFVEVGVAEQNMVGMAAGMARAGKIPFTASFAVFSPGRSWDQVRVSVCYSNANVKIYGGHAGITVGEDGATHQAMEDLAIMRTLPNMVVIAPSDAEEMRKATLAAAEHDGPVYLRGGRAKMEAVTTKDSEFVIGKANILRQGNDITIIACGIMVGAAIEAAKHLAEHDIQAEVINCHTLKPIDSETIVESAKKTGAVVTAEEHQINGGLGSAVAEVLAEHHPTRMIRVGMNDAFGESGSWQELLEKYKLNATGIMEAVHRVKG